MVAIDADAVIARARSVREGFQPIASRQQGGDDVHERGGGLRSVSVGVVPIAVMQQDDTSWSHSVESPAGDLRLAGAIAVPDAERPPDTTLSMTARGGGNERAAESVRGTVVPRMYTARIDDGRGAIGDVALGSARPRQVELAVREAVVGDLMTVIDHSADQGGPAYHVSTQQKEGGRYVVLGEQVEDARSRFWVGAVVEGEGRASPDPGEPGDDRSEESAVAVQGGVGAGGGEGSPEGGEREDRVHQATA